MHLQAFVDVAQIVSALVLIFTLFALLQQLKLLEKQTDVAREVSRAQTTFDVIQTLNSPEVRRARRIVGVLHTDGTSFDRWTPDEYEAVRTACSSYDAAGVMTRLRAADRAVILGSWGPSLRSTYRVALPLIRQRERHFGTTAYWQDFKQLAAEADAAALPDPE